MSNIDPVARQIARLHGHIHVGADKRLYGQDGKRFFIRGVQEFNDCFALFTDGYRKSWWIRGSQSTIASVSPPISSGLGLAKWLSLAYVDSATARAKLVTHKQYGFNCIRIWVGIGMVQTAAFTDSVSGLSFPNELEILDDIIQSAAQLGMAVWLSFAQGSVPDATAAEFWGIMAARYARHWNVILDIENEPGSGTVYNDPNNPTATVAYSTVMTSSTDWATRMALCLTAIRDAGFINPVAVSPYANLWHIDTVIAKLDDSGLPFKTDPNLIVGVHPYYIHGNSATAFSSDQASFSSFTYNYADYYCVVASESGFTPDFNYADSTAAQAWLKQMITFFQQEKFNGSIFFTTQPQHDNLNDIFDATTGVLTPVWGNIVTGYSTSGHVQPVQMTPLVATTSGTLTDTSTSTMLWRRHGHELEVTVQFNIVITTNGTGAGKLIFALPMLAPTDHYQNFEARSSASGARLIGTICGGSATITNPDGTYPGADGVTVSGTARYFAKGPGIASYTPTSFANSQYLTRGANLTGVSDGKAGTAAFYTNGMTGGDGSQQTFCTTSNSRFAILRNASNQIALQLRNSANTIIGAMVSDVLATVAHGPLYGLVAWDLAAGTIIMNVGGSGGTITTNTNDTIDYTDTDFAVGGTVGGSNLLQADMNFFWFTPTFIDFTTSPPHGNFLDYKNTPTEMGFYGTQPLGNLTLPALFFRRIDTAASFYTNNGYGGGFTKHP